jgi:hypothetical protein
MGKYLFLVTLFFLVKTSLKGQNPINILRYNDNFIKLKYDSTKTGSQKLKYIAVGKNSFLSVGGELREVYQYFKNQNFGDVPPTFKLVSTGQLWHRLMLHANLEIRAKTRVFFQVNNTLRFLNPNPLAPEIDENAISIHQAFVDWNIHKNWQLRIGRQELGYGNSRMLSFREGPNTRLTFDAALLKFKNDQSKIELLAISPVISKPKVFDDQALNIFIFGLYASETLIPKKLALDYYFLNFKAKNRLYNYVSGNENRQSYGIRLYSTHPRFNYEIETIYQTGKFNQLNISAYGLSMDINYKLNQKNNLIIGLAGNYITGDKDKSDTKLNTFNLLYSRPFYGLAVPIGSSNIENLNPYLKINPTKKLSLQAGVYFIERNSNQDGTYSPGMGQVRPSPKVLFTSKKHTLGSQIAFDGNYIVNSNLLMAAEYAFFKAGSYVKETGKGLNINYFSLKSSLKF